MFNILRLVRRVFHFILINFVRRLYTLLSVYDSRRLMVPLLSSYLIIHSIADFFPAVAPPMPYPYSPPAPPKSPPQRSQDPRSSPSTRPALLPTSSTPPLASPPERDSVTSSSIPFPVKPSHAPKPSMASGPVTPTSPTRLPFSSAENLPQKKRVGSGGTVKVVTQDDTNSSFHLRASGDDEGSELGGLAYAQSDESDDDGVIERRMVSTPTRLRRSPSISSSAYSDDHLRSPVENGLDLAVAALLGSPASTDKVLSPPSVNRILSPPSVEMILSPASTTSSLPRGSKPPTRSLTSPTQRESPTLAGTVNRRGGTISGAIGGGSSDKSRRKERSSEESSASGLGNYRDKTVFTCMRCSKDIEDNRWIQVENGRGVLCGKCWKNMYLPKVREFFFRPDTVAYDPHTRKCRRCNRPIEKQAVSSSDGQLKGKYHRDCFNCHTCHVCISPLLPP